MKSLSGRIPHLVESILGLLNGETLFQCSQVKGRRKLFYFILYWKIVIKFFYFIRKFFYFDIPLKAKFLYFYFIFLGNSFIFILFYVASQSEKILSILLGNSYIFLGNYFLKKFWLFKSYIILAYNWKHHSESRTWTFQTNIWHCKCFSHFGEL